MTNPILGLSRVPQCGIRAPHIHAVITFARGGVRL